MKFVLLLLGIAVTAAQCTGPQANNAVPKDKTDSTASAGGNAPAASSANWKYEQEEDKMTSKPAYYASVEANELLQLKFPYNGGTTVTIFLRNKGGKNEVMLQLSKGQFMANVVSGQDIMVRFDSLKAEKFPCVAPGDGSTTVLFISNEAKFLSKLKKAKKALIEAELFNEGNQVMEFNVEGLKWDH